jgi:hypothetical protein
VGYAAGGGISNSLDGAVQGSGSTELTVVNCAIDHNEAIGGNENTGNGAMAFVGAGLGGGIANYLGATSNIENSSISHNRAVGGEGNVSSGGAAPANLGAGGGIFNALGNFELDTGDVLAASIVNVSNSMLAHNQAKGGSDAGGSGGDAWGGAIAGLFDATTSVMRSLLADNLAIGGQGGSGGNGGNGYGGGAYNDATSSLTLRASTITKNHANGGDGGSGADDGDGVGGGIYNLGELDFDALTVISKNHASTSHDDIFG